MMAMTPEAKVKKKVAEQLKQLGRITSTQLQVGTDVVVCLIL